MQKISFTNSRPAFSSTLKKRVQQYFATTRQESTGNAKLYVKTAILISSAAICYTLLVFFTPATWVSILLCAVFGLCLASIGFNVMHDGGHGSYSNHKWINKIMASSLDLMGGSSYMWRIKHNEIHHSFTNIDGHDDDINIEPLMRTNANQKKYWFHRYQHVYSFVLYSLLYILWVFGTDYKKYFTGRIANKEVKGMETKDHIKFWAGKIVHMFMMIVLPIMMVGFVPTLIGYLVVVTVTGLSISIIFQLAHVVEGAAFPMPDSTTNKVEEEWTIHQLATTANFSTKSKLISWFAGGLNFQVEHHLFPKISHVHYPAISKIVKEVCAEYQVKYQEYPTLISALRSHVAYLKYIGRN